MPGAVTEPKSTSWEVWEVTAQIVEERIKLKQSNTRVALALRNAKIHRPALYASSKRSFNSGLENTTRMTDTAHSRNSRVKTFPPKKVNHVNCKKKLSIEAIREKSKSQFFSRDQVPGKSRSKLDLKNLRCSCQIATDTTVCNKCEPDPALEKTESRTESDDKPDKLVALSTVNVQPWENDAAIKTASEIGEPADQRSMDDGDRRVRRADLSRLVSLLHDSSARRQEHMKKCSSDDDGTEQHASPKLHRPGRITYAHTSHRGQVDVSGLSGILLVSSKMPENPWSLEHLPPLPPIQRTNNIKRTKQDVPVFERGPILSLMKTDCHLCTECRQTFQNVPRLYGADKESENLIRLKHSLKLKERQFLEVERSFHKTSQSASFDNRKTSCVELNEDPRTKLGEESVTLPKLYLAHHSTATDRKQKTKKPSLAKITDANMTSEECSNHRCYKLARIDKNSAHEKPLKNSAKKGSSSKKLGEISGSLQTQANHLGLSTTPLRGFTPYCSDLAESPMLWREDSELKGTEKDEDTRKEDVGVQKEEKEYIKM